MANPVTLAEVQQHLRLGTLDATEQAEIEIMITSATELAEAFCNRSWRSGTSAALFDSFPASDRTPLVINADIQSVSVVDYYDTDHSASTFTAYRVVNNSGRSSVYPSFGSEWPSDSNEMPASITVNYTAGDESSVPSSVKSAILLMAGDLYEHRENDIAGTIVSKTLTTTSKSLLHPFKTRIA